MYIHGSFLSQQSDTITVHIVTGNDRTQTIEIGTEKADIYFSEDPAEIENEVNDTFDVLLRNSAKIRLLCGNLIKDLFSTSCRDAVARRSVWSSARRTTFLWKHGVHWEEVMSWIILS